MSMPARSLLAVLGILLVSLSAAAAETPPSLSSNDGVSLPSDRIAQYFIEEKGKALGPLTLQQLRAWIAAGNVGADRLVWKSGTTKWVAARDLLDIAEAFPHADARSPASATPVKKVTTVPVAPNPPPSDDLSTFLTGTWKNEGGKGTDTIYAFGPEGTLAIRARPSAGGEPVTVRGTFKAERTSPKDIRLQVALAAEAGGDPSTQDGERALEIVDADAMRDKQSGAVLHRTTRDVELRVKPVPDAACGGGKVLLSDDFRQVDEKPAAKEDDPSVAVEAGKVKVKPRGDRRFQFVYADTRFADGEVCITAQIPRTFQNPVEVVGGVIFWARDLANYYGFAVSPTGNAGLVRQIDGRFETLVAFRRAQGLNSQPGAKNVLRVVMKGGAVTAYVNGVRFDGTGAQPPAGGGSVGFFVQSEGARPDAWKFGRLVVSEASR